MFRANIRWIIRFGNVCVSGRHEIGRDKDRNGFRCSSLASSGGETSRATATLRNIFGRRLLSCLLLRAKAIWICRVNTSWAASLIQSALGTSVKTGCSLLCGRQGDKLGTSQVIYYADLANASKCFLNIPGITNTPSILNFWVISNQLSWYKNTNHGLLHFLLHPLDSHVF